MKAVFVIVLALPLVILGCSVKIGVKESEVQKSFQVSGSPRLVVETENGDITVRSSGGAGEVRVIAAITNTDKVEYQDRPEWRYGVCVSRLFQRGQHQCPSRYRSGGAGKGPTGVER